MRKMIKFESVDAASRVLSHLYRTTQDEDLLIFSDFMKEENAFKLAVALEGLTEADYCCISAVSGTSPYCWDCAESVWKTRFLLKFNTERLVDGEH